MQQKKKRNFKIDTKDKSYNLKDSIFYKLQSKKKLSKILDTPLETLKSLCKDSNYICFEQVNNGKIRSIQHPTEALDRVHTRIASLVSRIIQPSYIHSGIREKSHITNAMSHVGKVPVLTVDLVSFFNSTKIESVYFFFYRKLQCSNDVAKLLASLCTYNSHIPTGSRISMPIAFWSNFGLFEELHKLAVSRNIRMTVFVDDLTFSGSKVTRQFKQNVEKIVISHRHELSSHKTRLYGQDEVKIITGVAVSESGIHVANRHHASIHSEMAQWLAIKNEYDKSIPQELNLKVARRLIGKLNSQGQIDKRFKDKARNVKNAIN